MYIGGLAAHALGEFGDFYLYWKSAALYRFDRDNPARYRMVVLIRKK
ncbi:hypothetical protein BN1221_02748 [Brenneria goodwinii]|uniref:Uncharacterized protein n=1 Tax=Brenneria goodwinii TaxID=1109412 RepID=A0A0G4JWG0_9GAMM|nr:hypothetical protein BN1221_02748 [Brenneria goodwinii]